VDAGVCGLIAYAGYQFWRRAPGQLAAVGDRVLGDVAFLCGGAGSHIQWSRFDLFANIAVLGSECSDGGRCISRSSTCCFFLPMTNCRWGIGEAEAALAFRASRPPNRMLRRGSARSATGSGRVVIAVGSGVSGWPT